MAISRPDAVGSQVQCSTSGGVPTFCEAFYNDHPLMMGVVELIGDDFLHLADNVAAARFLGVEPGETEGKSSRELGVPEHAFDDWLAPCREAERTGGHIFFEYEHETPTGTRILSVLLMFLGYGTERHPRFSYSVKDVTEHRKELEEVHRVQRERAIERRATEILESLTDGFIALDREFRFTFVNPEAERLLQRSRPYLLGVTFWDAFPETVGLNVDRVYHEAMREQVTRELEEYNPVLDTWFSAKIYPSPEGLSVYFRATTEQKKMEMALAKQHATVELERRRLQAILDILPVGVFLTDATGRVVQANQKGRAIWGDRTPASEGPDAYADDYPAWWPSTGKRVESHEWAVARALATGEITIAEEVLIEAGDGTRKTILNYALPVQDTDGEMVGAVAVNVDITDRKRMEEALQEHATALVTADRAKDEFLAMLGHELRNPLGTVANATELLRRICVGRAECREPVAVLQEQVRHMARLLDDLLDVSRITTGRLELRQEPVDVNLVVRKAIDGTAPLMESRGHLLSVVYAPGPVWAHGDAARLQQVVANLLTNAAKYTPMGGRIGVSITEEESEAVVCVRDNGEGIAPDLLPRIFDVFAQGARPLNRAPGGLGIGLTVVRRLVEMHGGSVEAHSEGPGLGSAFVVRLPRIHEENGTRSEEAHGAQGSRSLHILVVEDNLLARSTLKRLLECDGHRVNAVEDGPSAIRALREGTPDAVLLDIGLPGMDGYEVARRLRANPACARTFLVAVTGYGQDADLVRARDAGIDEHLVKPIDFERLGHILGTIAADGNQPALPGCRGTTP